MHGLGTVELDEIGDRQQRAVSQACNARQRFVRRAAGVIGLVQGHQRQYRVLRGPHVVRNETQGFLALPLGLADGRSEEHTSELQSLMRISYAVFCLKKKNEIK